MPNLEYSVRFVLTADSTKDIDDALRRMRESGSTIEVKLKTDTSGFTSEMNKVKSELEKVEQTTQKMSRSASKTSGMYKILAKDISGALNQFKATGNLKDAEQAFSGIEQRIRAFGSSLDQNSPQMQEYYKLLNMNASAVRALDKETNNSSNVMKARQAEERALNEEVKRSSAVLRARASAAKFDAKQQAQANAEISDGVRGTISELRRLSVTGQATNEQLTRLFFRTAESEEDLTVTTEDLSAAFARQAQIIQASNIPYKQKQQLLNNIMMAEQQSAQSIRVVNRGLAQQGEGVGDVSYAMMSFTRLLEDIPYGFRGFANNIQPTIFGLIQMNETTEKAAMEFRKLHGKEMPLAQRALLNLKSAISSPINQLLLLTSAIAVAGTFIERWSQNSNKAKEATKSLGDQFIRLYDVVKGENPLDTDYSQSIQGLEEYANALESALNIEVELTNERLRGMAMLSSQGAIVSPSLLEKGVMNEQLKIAKDLSKEARDRLKVLQTEAEVQKFILGNERARLAIEQQRLRTMVSARSEAAGLTAQEIRDNLEVERTRARSGEEAAALAKRNLALRRLDEKSQREGIAVVNERLAVQAQYELDLFNIRNKSNQELNKTKAEYESTVQALQRQLQDETQMFSIQRLRVEQAREIADLEARHAEAKAKGAEIPVGLLEEEKRLINQIYGARIQRETQSSALVTKNLTDQFQITTKLLQAEQSYLMGQDRLGTELELQAMEMEYQLQLKQQLADLDTEGITDATELALRQSLITKELQAQYRLRLVQRASQARQGVRDFLAPQADSDVARIQQRQQQALLDAESAYYSEKASIEEQYKNDFMGRMTALTILSAKYANDRVKIERTAANQIAMVRASAYIEGAMMITSALEDLNSSREARNRQEFESQKRFSASLATINTLLGITQVLSDPDLGTFLKFAQASAMAITGFAQVRQILATKYGSAGTGGYNAPQSPNQGFIESDVEARGSVSGTVLNAQPQIVVNVTGKVDREGIAFMVNDGFDQIGSRGVVLQ